MSDLLRQTREICQMLEIKPARTKGQNFLINEKIYEEMIKAAAVGPEDFILEIGPGLGFLTAKLAQKAKQVTAIELDDKLAAYLQMAVDAWGRENVAVINEDVLRFNWPEYWRRQREKGYGGYKIVANLPYNISSFFLRLFVSASERPERLVLMLQKEVAERIVARPPDMNLLAVSVQHQAAAEIIRIVKAGNFWPEPQVDSAIIRLTPFAEAAPAAADKLFFRLVRMGFSAKRKMLKNNLAAGLPLSPGQLTARFAEQGIPGAARAEDLSLEDWHKLFAALRPHMV